eukprot:TRINITY_DN7370_c0_g1_i10.p2 TRINITY_DN7370_c0_g1~~TRINITY_DN7370_c0_g1_i10.p2  ORF type:complete len:108 (-),score=2.60 TRINITY_DN7370_c0_g1_i10:16-339(-)
MERERLREGSLHTGTRRAQRRPSLLRGRGAVRRPPLPEVEVNTARAVPCRAVPRSASLAAAAHTTHTQHGATQQSAGADAEGGEERGWARRHGGGGRTGRSTAKGEK